MRRLQRNETLHGTRDGQLAIDADLRAAFGLTDRESAVAALLAQGCPAGGIAEHLQITRSTADKHLAALRQKLQVRTTTEAAAAVARFSLEQAAGIRDWPVCPPNDPSFFQGTMHAELSGRLATAPNVDAAVRFLRDSLRPEGVEATQFVFLPRNAISFQRGGFVESWAAPSGVVDAYHACGGLRSHPVALRLFAQPDREVFLDAEHPESDGTPELWDACREEGLRFSVTLGAPFGCGFVGSTMFFTESARDALENQRAKVVGHLRFALLVAQGSMFARGLLARTFNLTLRERNALTSVAQGMTLEAAAREVRGSSRGLSQHLKSAREKLGAQTNAEAVAQAMAVNALVFL